MGKLLDLICPTAKAEYFLEAGLTEITDLPVGQLVHKICACPRHGAQH
jgi:hypothetical protein